MILMSLQVGIVYPCPPRTYYVGTGALKGTLRAYYLGPWGARDRAILEMDIRFQMLLKARAVRP